MAAQAKSAPLRVVVLGDSLIWGQGLREVEKFSTTALKEIARLAGRQLDVERNLSRSGAQILEGQDETQRRAKRQEYVDTYPSRYNSQKLRDDFVLRNDQLVTFFLPSEVPNTFPTITFQVGVVSEAIGKGIDIVLLDGGVNDIDFETYLNPFEAEGNFIAAFDGMFQEVFDRRVRELLLSARRRFPNALLIYTGYFLPFSFNVRNGAVLDFVEYEKSVDWFDRFLNGIFGVVDFPRVVAELQVRAEHGVARGLYWLRRNITKMSDELESGGPGVIFIHPSFLPEHVLFSPQTLLHSEYKPDKDHDGAAEIRLQQIPRIDIEAKIRALVADIQERRATTSRVHQLRLELDGPTALLDALGKWEQDMGSMGRALEVSKLLSKELNRITHAKIASFIHPNERGAQRYSRRIVDRYDQLHRLTRIGPSYFDGAGNGRRQSPVSIKAAFARYGISGVQSLRRLMQLSVIDSVAVTVDIATQSIRPDALFDDIILEMSDDLSWRLNLPYIARPEVDSSGRPTGRALALARLTKQFVPGTSEFITLDARGLRLFQIERLVIRRRPSDVLEHAVSPPRFTDEQMRISKIRLELNGIQVYVDDRLQTLTRTKPLVMSSYPAG